MSQAKSRWRLLPIIRSRSGWPTTSCSCLSKANRSLPTWLYSPNNNYYWKHTTSPPWKSPKGTEHFIVFPLCCPLSAPNGAPDFKHNNRLWNITRSNSGCNLHVIFLFQRPAVPRIAESGPAHNGTAIKGGKRQQQIFHFAITKAGLSPPPSLVMHRTCAEAAPQTSSARTKTSGERMLPCLTKVNLDGTEQLQTSYSGASMKHFPQQTEGPLDSLGFNLSYQVTRRAAARGGTCDGWLCAEKRPPTRTDLDPCSTSSEECHPGS